MPSESNWYHKFRLCFSGRWPRFYAFCDQNKSYIKFIVAGVLAGGTDLLLLFLFHGLGHLDIVLATSLAFIMSFLISFSLQKYWTFRNHHRGRMVHQLFFYILNALLSLYLNGLLMHLLVNQHQVWYILAQIIVNLILAVWNFVIYKFFIFKHTNHETDSE